MYAQFLGNHVGLTFLVLVCGALCGFVAILYSAARLTSLLQRRAIPLVSTVSTRYPKISEVVREGVKSRRYLGWYLVVGVILSFVLLSAFSGVAELLHESRNLRDFDQLLAQSYRTHSTLFEVAFFRTITDLAGRGALYGVGVAVGLFLLVRKEFSLLVVWVSGLIGNGMINAGLKAVFHRARPTLQDPFLVEQNFSFPSGHAMSVIVIYGLVAYIFARVFSPTMARLAVTFTIVSAVAVGMSRLVLGVHYLSDVVGGWLIGFAWLAIVLTGAEFIRRFRAIGRADPVLEQSP